MVFSIIQFDQVDGWNGRKPFIVLEESPACLPENGQLHLRNYVKTLISIFGFSFHISF